MAKKLVCGAATRKCKRCKQHQRQHGKGKAIRHVFKAKPCEEDKLMANGKCYRHGGPTPTGPALPQFKHGRYSKALPAGLVARFEASMADPQLLELRSELSLVDARIEELLGRVQAEETVGRWSDATTVYQRMRVAYQSRRPSDAATALTELGDILERGNTDVELWKQLGESLDRRARFVVAESHRMEKLHQMISVERVWALILALTQAVRKHVDDRSALALIQQDFRKLTGRRDGEES